MCHQVKLQLTVFQTFGNCEMYCLPVTHTMHCNRSNTHRDEAHTLSSFHHCGDSRRSFTSMSTSDPGPCV